ncbi:MAG TPA: class I SAM-dependent methyltransferase, partial [Epsilonproteobacteria bacterium]|nr:class I SAM-dependent methyltransferase [Campylobacterota bacterium]
MGKRFLQKIEHGSLDVCFPDGKQESYGDEKEPRASLEIHSANFFRRLAFYGDIGFAESYMDGEFDTPNLTKLIELALLNSHRLGTKSEDYKKNLLANLFPFSNRIKHV